MAIFHKPDQQKAIKSWNALALGNSESVTIAHNPALFSFFLDFLKLKPVYLMLQEEGDLVGVLPIVNTEKGYISLPHFSTGGICWRNGFKPKQDENEILISIARLFAEERLDAGFYTFELSEPDSQKEKRPISFEIRSTKPFFGKTSAEKVMHQLKLEKTGEKQFKTFNTNLRRKISKAEKNGIKIKSGKSELVDDFALVYNKNMHQIGSPTLGGKYFRALLETEDSNAEILVAYLDQKPIGGAFNMWYDGYCENTWFSTLQQYNKLYPSYLLHWETMRLAIDRGIETYSLGRSTKGGGVHQYKLQWPVEEIDLYFSNTVGGGFSLKDQKWLTSVWKKLPGFFVDAVGPVVAKRIY